jgi:serine O-acetyltransferase
MSGTILAYTPKQGAFVTMILTKKDYYRYVQADKKAMGIRKDGLLKDWAKRLLNWEKILLQDYIITLRKLEYLHNVRKNPLQYVRYALVFYRYRRKCLKLSINIPINVTGPGLCIHHIGPITINKLVRIGSNCTLQPGVVIGQNRSEENVPIIGDNVYFSPGAKVFGKLRIGDNVVIAPNSVVVKDVADNCTVSGIPAQIIRRPLQRTSSRIPTLAEPVASVVPVPYVPLVPLSSTLALAPTIALASPVDRASPVQRAEIAGPALATHRI